MLAEVVESNLLLEDCEDSGIFYDAEEPEVFAHHQTPQF